MKKKGVAWQFLILGIIAVVVMIIILVAFKGLFGREADTTKDRIDDTSKDYDCDGVMNIFDKCCTRSDIDKVGLDGCAPSDTKPSDCGSPIC